MMKRTYFFIGALLFSSSSLALVSTKYTTNCQPLAAETGKYPEKKGIKGFPSESSYKKVQEANQALADGNKALAKRLLNEVKSSSAWSNPYVESVVSQFLSSMEYEAGNFNGAVNYAKRVVQLNALPIKTILGMKKQVAYAYIGKKDYKSAISWIKQYFDQVINPPVSDYKQLASLYYQDKQYRNAICPLYVALKKTNKKKEKESLYKMLYQIHYLLKDNPGAAAVLKEMINFYPDEKKYWQALFTIYYTMGDNLSALAVYEVGYLKGMWTTEQEIKTLASLHSNNRSPLKAGTRIDDGIKKGIIPSTLENWEMLANYYDQAKENDKAVVAFNKTASLSSTGKYNYRIGNIYASQEKFKEAIPQFQKAIAKGNMKDKDTGNSYLQLAISQYHSGSRSAALQSLRNATKYKTTERTAKQWIGFINDKIKTENSLKAIKQEETAEANSQGS